MSDSFDHLHCAQTALCCSTLFAGDQNVGRKIQHFFCLKCCYALLGEMLDLFDHSNELAKFTDT